MMVIVSNTVSNQACTSYVPNLYDKRIRGRWSAPMISRANKKHKFKKTWKKNVNTSTRPTKSSYN